MAIGDAAIAEGFPIVPDDGTEGQVAFGAREINRTRDLIARRTRSGTTLPSNANGQNGDIFFLII